MKCKRKSKRFGISLSSLPQEDIRAVDDNPDDDKFLEAAVAGDVDYLVSGDGHLLSLDSYHGIDIVEPRTFYERLDTS
jgi:predicted nucleic acid-binding protein